MPLFLIFFERASFLSALNLFPNLWYDKKMMKKEILKELFQSLQTMDVDLKRQNDQALLVDVVSNQAYQRANTIAKSNDL